MNPEGVIVAAHYGRHADDQWSVEELLQNGAHIMNRNMSRTADIEQLMRKAQTGEPLAIAGLLEHWYPDLRRYAQRHCHASYAEDAVQETCWW